MGWLRVGLGGGLDSGQACTRCAAGRAQVAKRRRGCWSQALRQAEPLVAGRLDTEGGPRETGPRGSRCRGEAPCLDTSGLKGGTAHTSGVTNVKSCTRRHFNCYLRSGESHKGQGVMPKLR